MIIIIIIYYSDSYLSATVCVCVCVFPVRSGRRRCHSRHSVSILWFSNRRMRIVECVVVGNIFLTTIFFLFLPRVQKHRFWCRSVGVNGERFFFSRFRFVSPPRTIRCCPLQTRKHDRISVYFRRTGRKRRERRTNNK